MKTLSIAILLACAAPLRAGEAAKAPASAADVHAAAKKTFKAQCAACHGAKAEGKEAMAKVYKVAPEALDLARGDAAAKSEAELVKVISDGKGKMMAFKGKLDKDQIQGLARFLASLRAPKPKVEAKPAAKAESSK